MEAGADDIQPATNEEDGPAGFKVTCNQISENEEARGK